MRLSLASLLIATAVFGLLLAGIAWPNQFWAEIVFSVTLLCLTAAALAAAALPPDRRWFWIGFSVVGLGYLMLANYFDGARPLLLTHRALVELDDVARFSEPRQLLDGTRASWTPKGAIEVTRPGGIVFYLSREDASRLGYLQLAYPSPGSFPSSKNYYNNGHLAWAWLVGAAAGAFFAWLRRTSVARVAPRPSASQSATDA